MILTSCSFIWFNAPNEPHWCWLSQSCNMTQCAHINTLSHTTVNGNWNGNSCQFHIVSWHHVNSIRHLTKTSLARKKLIASGPDTMNYLIDDFPPTLQQKSPSVLLVTTTEMIRPFLDLVQFLWRDLTLKSTSPFQHWCNARKERKAGTIRFNVFLSAFRAPKTAGLGYENMNV